jgi:flagellar hook capping protein FlgD
MRRTRHAVLTRLRWAALAVAVLSWGATDLAAGPLSVTRWSIDCGGAAFARVGTFTLAGTIGQPDAGLLQGRTYAVLGGFWGAGPLQVTGVPIPEPGDPAEPAPDPVPLVARVLPAAPNPTSSAARLGFELPEARRVRIQVFGVTGALVRTVTDRVWPAGRHEIVWDGVGDGGGASAAGLYFVRVRLGSMERTQKLLVVR